MAHPDPATARFFADVARSGGLPPGVSAAQATRAVLCPLLLRVSLGAARSVLAALPPALRSLLEGCPRGHAENAAVFDERQFRRMVRYRLPDTGTEQTDDIIRAVLQGFQALLPPKQQRDIASQLPKDMKSLLPPTRRAA